MEFSGLRHHGLHGLVIASHEATSIYKLGSPRGPRLRLPSGWTLESSQQ